VSQALRGKAKSFEINILESEWLAPVSRQTFALELEKMINSGDFNNAQVV